MTMSINPEDQFDRCEKCGRGIEKGKDKKVCQHHDDISALKFRGIVRRRTK